MFSDLNFVDILLKLSLEFCFQGFFICVLSSVILDRNLHQTAFYNNTQHNIVIFTPLEGTYH